MLTYGTCHFVSLRAAQRYYARQGLSWADVGRKLEAGEIYIGPPTLGCGKSLTIIPGEGRYAITEH